MRDRNNIFHFSGIKANHVEFEDRAVAPVRMLFKMIT